MDMGMMKKQKEKKAKEGTARDRAEKPDAFCELHGARKLRQTRKKRRLRRGHGGLPRQTRRGRKARPFRLTFLARLWRAWKKMCTYRQLSSSCESKAIKKMLEYSVVKIEPIHSSENEGLRNPIWMKLDLF